MVQKSKQGESIETAKTVAGENVIIVGEFSNISKIDDGKPKDWRKHEKSIALFHIKNCDTVFMKALGQLKPILTYVSCYSQP